MSYPVYISLTGDNDLHLPLKKNVLKTPNLSALLNPAFIELLLFILSYQETVAHNRLLFTLLVHCQNLYSLSGDAVFIMGYGSKLI